MTNNAQGLQTGAINLPLFLKYFNVDTSSPDAIIRTDKPQLEYNNSTAYIITDNCYTVILTNFSGDGSRRSKDGLFFVFYNRTDHDVSLNVEGEKEKLDVIPPHSLYKVMLGDGKWKKFDYNHFQRVTDDDTTIVLTKNETVLLDGNDVHKLTVTYDTHENYAGASLQLVNNTPNDVEISFGGVSEEDKFTRVLAHGDFIEVLWDSKKYKVIYWSEGFFSSSLDDENKNIVVKTVDPQLLKALKIDNTTSSGEGNMVSLDTSDADRARFGNEFLILNNGDTSTSVKLNGEDDENPIHIDAHDSKIIRYGQDSRLHLSRESEHVNPGILCPIGSDHFLETKYQGQTPWATGLIMRGEDVYLDMSPLATYIDEAFDDTSSDHLYAIYFCNRGLAELNVMTEGGTHIVAKALEDENGVLITNEIDEILVGNVQEDVYVVPQNENIRMVFRAHYENDKWNISIENVNVQNYIPGEVVIHEAKDFDGTFGSIWNYWNDSMVILSGTSLTKSSASGDQTMTLTEDISFSLHEQGIITGPIKNYTDKNFYIYLDAWSTGSKKPVFALEREDDKHDLFIGQVYLYRHQFTHPITHSTYYNPVTCILPTSNTLDLAYSKDNESMYEYPGLLDESVCDLARHPMCKSWDGMRRAGMVWGDIRRVNGSLSRGENGELLELAIPKEYNEDNELRATKSDALRIAESLGKRLPSYMESAVLYKEEKGKNIGTYLLSSLDSADFKGVKTSTDGVSYVKNPYMGAGWFLLLKGKDRLIGAGHGIYSQGLYYSTDYKTWNRSNVRAGNYEALIYNKDIYLVASFSGSTGIKYSYDGITWEDSNITSGNFACLAYSQDTSYFYAGSSDGSGILKSSDGITWSKTSVEDGSWYHIICENGKVFAAGTKGIMYSSDGNGFLLTNIIDTNIYGLTANADASIMVAISTGNGVYYSTTGGVTWEECNAEGLNGEASFYSCVFCNDKFIIASQSGNGGVFYSTDGINWAATNLEGTFALIAFYSGIYFAGSMEGGLFYSADGITFQKTSEKYGYFWRSGCFVYIPLWKKLTASDTNMVSSVPYKYSNDESSEESRYYFLKDGGKGIIESNEDTTSRVVASYGGYNVELIQPGDAKLYMRFVSPSSASMYRFDRKISSANNAVRGFIGGLVDENGILITNQNDRILTGFVRD